MPLVEFDPDVLSYEEQPVRIDYLSFENHAVRPVLLLFVKRLTIQGASRNTLPSALWGASCPRQGRLLPPIWAHTKLPEPSSCLYSADARQ
jgi:hypothetical protein